MRGPASLAVVLLLAGCDALSRYATEEGESYRGAVVGVEEPAVLRRGFPAQTELTLTFDPANATSLAQPPGRLTTSDGALNDEPLLPIIPLTHDVLSEYEVPSGERLRNYLFLVRPATGPLAGREPMVFVSLMGDGTIEVRIIAGTGTAADDYYGLFRVSRPR